MNDNGEWPADDTPNGPYVIVWHDEHKGGLKAIFHRKDGCEYAKPGYMAGVKYVFLEQTQAEGRFGMRCCKKCEFAYAPTLIQVRLASALTRFIALRPGSGRVTADDMAFMEQALAEVGLELVKKKGT